MYIVPFDTLWCRDFSGSVLTVELQAHLMIFRVLLWPFKLSSKCPSGHLRISYNVTDICNSPRILGALGGLPIILAVSGKVRGSVHSDF